MNSVLGVVLLAAAAGAYAAVNSDSTTPARTGTRTATVAKGTVLATVSGSGSLVSPSDAGASFTTGGRLTEVKVAPGDKVTKGEVLAKVDPTDADETLSVDQATLTADEANLTKAEEGQTTTTSSGSGGGSGRGGSAAQSTTTTTVDPASVAQAQAQVTQAQNAVTAARAAVAGTELTAPVSGTVASVGGKVGDTVSGSSGSASGNSGGSGSGSGSGSNSSSSSSSSSSTEPTGFVVITNPTGMQVTADFSEADSLKIKAGQPATVTLNAESGTVLNAKVLSISSLPVSSGSGGGDSGSSAVQYAATLAISGSTANLRTGLSATIQVVTGEASDALYVPAEAVSGTGAATTVTVVAKDGTTRTVNVTVGVQGDTDDAITSGLTQGETVQIASVASTGTNGFPSGAFPGGAGGGRTFGGGGGGGGRGFGGGGGGLGGGRG